MAEVQQVGSPTRPPDTRIEPSGPRPAEAAARPGRVMFISVFVFAAGLVTLGLVTAHDLIVHGGAPPALRNGVRS
jgi:hypothetical protein